VPGAVVVCGGTLRGYDGATASARGNGLEAVLVAAPWPGKIRGSGPFLVHVLGTRSGSAFCIRWSGRCTEPRRMIGRVFEKSF
jgi:hypothetical protein